MMAAVCKHGDSRCPWCSMVERTWREKFVHSGPRTPSVGEMERMLDCYGWNVDEPMPIAG